MSTVTTAEDVPEIELLTPSEDLVLEVLAARYRLGEVVWTFELRHRSAINRLINRSLVETHDSLIPKTIRVSLTATGKLGIFHKDYTAPAFKTGKGESAK